MNRPAVSVLMPFLNTEKFIAEAIDSVFAQTFDSWELLLIDDGSTDASTDIARRYTKQAPGKVQYFEHEGHMNRGASASRNLGFQHSRGEYIAFLDSDDVWLPGKLNFQVALLDKMRNVGMLCAASQYWYGWTDNPMDRARDRVVAVGAPTDAVIQPPKLLTLLYPLGKGISPCPSSLLLRRDVFEQIGGFEERFHSFYTDQAFLVKVYLTTPVFVTQAHYDLYRQHPGSSVALSHKAGRYHSVRHGFLCWLETYLSDAGIRGSEAWCALQKALWRYRHPVFFKLITAPVRIFARIRASTRGA